MLRRRIQALRLRPEAGSTLKELLVVGVVLGALGGIAASSVGGLTGKGRAVACKAEQQTVEIAYQAYVANENTKPATVDDLVTAGYLSAEPAAANGITLDATGAVTATGC